MFKDDLDKLLTLAESARTEPEWCGFADYLETHGRGLRKPALKALNQFLDLACNWAFSERQRFSVWLLTSLHAGAIVAPLRERLLVPTLREWNERSPNEAGLHLWLGLLGCDEPMAHFQKALEIDPGCEPAREKLAWWIKTDVDHNQHHLPAYYINDPSIDLLDLAEAESLCAGYESSGWGKIVLDDIREQRALAEAWLRDHPRAE